MPGPRTRYATSGDVHLAYQAIGEGQRDIVFVLDWASHLEAVWEQPFVQEFIASVNRYARVLWFDMRGVGLSDRVVDHVGATEEWMEDVFAVMDAAGSERATLIAHGHGVQMALMSAATHPDRVDSLVRMQEWYGRVERFAATPGTALAKMRAILDLDVRKVLPLVGAPALVVASRDGTFVRAAHGR